MSLLDLVTLVAIGLAAIAVLGGLVTIAVHAIRLRIDESRKHDYAQLLKEILQNLDEPQWSPELVKAMNRDRRLGADLFSEMSELIRGENRNRLLALCKQAGIDRWLMKQLHSWHPDRRRIAAHILMLFPGEDTIAALRAALKDRSGNVRLTAALSLAEFQATPPLSVLLQMLVKNKRKHPLLLHRLFDRLAVSSPGEVLDVAEGNVGGAFLRPIAIRALGKAGHLELSGAIAALIEDPEPEVRAAALDATGSLGNFNAKEGVKHALSDAVQFVRIRAIDAARRLGLHELAPEIVALLKDANWWVRFRAGEALAALGQPLPEAERKIVDLAAATRSVSAQRGAA